MRNRRLVKDTVKIQPVEQALGLRMIYKIRPVTLPTRPSILVINGRLGTVMVALLMAWAGPLISRPTKKRKFQYH